MHILDTSDYRIYIDNVRVDPYVIDWSSRIGLFASDASASITMFRTDAMDKLKPYLAQVRIFGRNVFTGKFCMLFDGEITSRNHSSSRGNMGTVTYAIRGYYHWLNIAVPMMIATYDEFVNAKRFEYEAQNINTASVLELLVSQKDALLKEKTIQQVIDLLIEQIHKGYFDLGKNLTAFDFVDLKNRFKVLGDIDESFRKAGFIDIATFVQATQIDTFYVYLNELLSQLMFEFYQDRDGSFKIKPPGWSGNILKNHIIDEFLVSNIAGLDNWDSEPTRVLVKGGTSELIRNNVNPIMPGASQIIGQIPMGLYIGTPEKGEFFSQRIEAFMKDYGVAPPPTAGSNFGGEVSGAWFDDLGSKQINQKHGADNPGNRGHRGVDYNFRYEPIKSIGTHGKVTLANKGNPTAGNWIIVEQNIDGKMHQFVYMHMSEFSVKVGDNVTPGQQLGISGNTGQSTGPHLHFEIWIGDRHNGGKNLNPVPFLAEMKTKFASSEYKMSGGSPTGGSQKTSSDSSGAAKQTQKSANPMSPFNKPNIPSGNISNPLGLRSMTLQSPTPRIDAPITVGPNLNQPVKVPGVQDLLDMTKKPTAKPVKYDPKRELKYEVPNRGSFYKGNIAANPSGVEGNLIACIISYQSNWNPKMESKTFVGLMGLNKEYAKNVLPNKDVLFGHDNLKYGAEFFSRCMERFNNKVTFSLLAYYWGNMGKVEELAKKAGQLNFKVARKDVDKDALKFVDGVIREYTALFDANYIEGDPNIEYGDPNDTGKNESIMFPSSASNTGLPDFQSNYRPMLSDEEKKYKMNLKVVEQTLLRNDLNSVQEGKYTIDGLLEKYARYIMYVSRAQAHNIQVTLNLCLPNLRPGFNAWLEPTRQDLVFYITGVSHHGSYGSGCASSITGGYVRETKSYDDIDESIFVGVANAHPEDFGNAMKKDDLPAMKKRLTEMHQRDDIVSSASDVELMKELYTIPEDKAGTYATIWNREFTEKELGEQIQKVFQSAPPLIKERAKEIDDAINKSIDHFVKYLLMQRND